MPLWHSASIMSCISFRMKPFGIDVPVPVIMVGDRPYCFMVGICAAVGRSIPLNPIRASTLHLSSNMGVEFPQTELMTLCFRRTGLDAAGVVCAACAYKLEARGIIANGAATLV